MIRAASTIAELCDLYVSHYRATHAHSKSHKTVASALRWLTATQAPAATEGMLFGDPVSIGSMRLNAIDSKLIKYVRRVMDTSATMKRQTVNDYLKRIQAMIAWAIDEEQLPEQHVPEAAAALLVKPLRKGQSHSPEQRTVRSATRSDVDVFVAMGSPKLATMVHVQRVTGMRSANLCAMNLRRIFPASRAGDGELQWPQSASLEDIKATLLAADVWVYVPERHKTMHHGVSYVAAIGPRSMAALGPWVRDLANDIVFEGTLCSRPSGRPITPDGYRCQLYKELDRLSIPRFRPHQLRHTAATVLDRTDADGIKKAQLLLGHTSEEMTRRYIDPDIRKIIDLARKHG